MAHALSDSHQITCIGLDLAWSPRNPTGAAVISGGHSELLSGPDRLLRWGVAVGRDHDDLLISAAFTARLDQLDWRPRVARGT